MTLLNLHAHQCTHGFSANPNLLLNVVTRQQAIQIARTLGYEKLKNWQSHNWRLSRYSEIGALEEIIIAIQEVTGISKPWIIGHGYEFGRCLLTFISPLPLWVQLSPFGWISGFCMSEASRKSPLANQRK
jgi:hypothetical protein